MNNKNIIVVFFFIFFSNVISIFSQNEKEISFESVIDDCKVQIIYKQDLIEIEIENKTVFYIVRIIAESKFQLNIENDNIELFNKFLNSSIYNIIAKKYNDLSGSPDSKTLEILTNTFWSVSSEKNSSVYKFDPCSESKIFRKITEINLIEGQYHILQRKFITDDSNVRPTNLSPNCFPILEDKAKYFQN